MIIHELNNRDLLMEPISNEKFDQLECRYGRYQLAKDLRFLSDRGLVPEGAVTPHVRVVVASD